MNRFQFVEDHRDAYGVKRLCRVLEIARSSFYRWRDPPLGGRRGGAPMRTWPPGSGASTPNWTAPTGPRGSPPNCATKG
ncbi:hypothetical protein GCM10009736_08980 [Actinomadura bangladeshensis]